MRAVFRAAWLAAGLAAGPARAQGVPPPAQAPAAQTLPGQEPPTAAANLAALQPCGARAARYEGEKGFGIFVTRIGRVRVDNPLRPLTPEVTQVLQVVIGARPATAYGPDLTTLRRGGAPGALEAQLGAPIRWEAALPDLPDPLAIVAEDGAPLATLAFRACTEAPAVKAPPVAARRDGKGDGKRNAEGDGKPPPRKGARATAAPKAPPGFQVPQGAIAE
ncbi:hypothetical protein [uncultured Methylobacterium sp.]|uniref:hypothetical protein n=1 Tax=uncultured Methylobacterium sp. TaxID=157278 RepID=UPI0035CB3A34